MKVSFSGVTVFLISCDVCSIAALPGGGVALVFPRLSPPSCSRPVGSESTGSAAPSERLEIGRRSRPTHVRVPQGSPADLRFSFVSRVLPPIQNGGGGHSGGQTWRRRGKLQLEKSATC